MKQADVAHDHLQLERELRTVSGLLQTLSTDGREVIELLDQLAALQLAMTAHHKDEETRLFPLAAQNTSFGDATTTLTQRGAVDPELQRLVNQHRDLEVKFAEIIDLLTYEGDIAGARPLLRAFYQAFDRHTLSEADYFSTRWDELFPGEIMAG